MNNIALSSDIALTRDTVADSIAVVRPLRQNQPDMAMFIIASYAAIMMDGKPWLILWPGYARQF
jgi:hypothetical protein